MKKNAYIKGSDIYYDGILRDIKKSANSWQPVYEGFTNSLEAINLLKAKKGNGKVTLRLFFQKTTAEGVWDFNRIVIEDTGIGFDDVNFERLQIYKDIRKGFNNKGSGRLQFLHFFDECNYESIFRTQEGFKKRSFTLSKSEKYLKENAIIHYLDTIPINSKGQVTTLTLKTLLDNKDQSFYNELRIEKLKEYIVSHYMMYFCARRKNLPEISIEQYVDEVLDKTVQIHQDDIPDYDKSKDLEIHYSKLSNDGASIMKMSKKEVFHLKAFKIDKDKLAKNEIKFTSKDEIVEDVKVALHTLPVTDHINDKRYLFLVSGNYIDQKGNDTRGMLNIPKADEFKESFNLFSGEEILLDDIETKVNSDIISMYDEIKRVTEEQKIDIEKLQKMFLLNESTLSHLTLSLNDTEEKILEKVYSSDAKTIAKRDAEIKENFERLDELDPTSSDYEKRFDETISKLVKAIPLQNRTALTHYVARRKLVLDLFGKILEKQLKIQSTSKRNIDEKLLHNLLFQQSTQDPEQSDLWLINEDFIYFNGTSENRLGEIKIEGEKLLKEKLTQEEEKYRLSLGEDRYDKRPDILLFPTECKCILIEFKNPDVNISEHLNQITRYASLIRNLSKDKFQFDTFYGYLIGESIDADDVRDYDAEFIHAYHLDYIFRPKKPIAGRFGRTDGTLYSEVIKYSTLLERAKMRNDIFIKKLTESKAD